MLSNFLKIKPDRIIENKLKSSVKRMLQLKKVYILLHSSANVNQAHDEAISISPSFSFSRDFALFFLMALQLHRSHRPGAAQGEMHPLCALEWPEEETTQRELESKSKRKRQNEIERNGGSEFTLLLVNPLAFRDLALTIAAQVSSY